MRPDPNGQRRIDYKFFLAILIGFILVMLLIQVCTPAPSHAESWKHFRAEYIKAHPLPKLPAELSSLALRPGDVEKWARWGLQRQKVLRAAKSAWRAAEAARMAQESQESDPGPPEGDFHHSGPIDWIAIARCESGLRWHFNGRYDGGLQFDPRTWRAAGGERYAAYAYQATPAQQIATAEAWVAKTGCVWCSSGWPYCGRFA